MAHIHPTAVVHPSAEIAPDVQIGPYCLIGRKVVIEGGTVLEAHVIVDENTFIGEDNHLYWGVVLGAPPQDRKYKAEKTFLRLGRSNLIREYVTIHRASGEGEETFIGNHNFLMANVHIGHNCRVGDHVVIANAVGISGHCVIEDGVNIGGMTGIHQFTRIGKLAMIGGLSRIVRDVPPFMVVEGNPAQVHGINVVGLRRAGFSSELRLALQTACRLLFHSGLNLHHAIEQIRQQVPLYPEVEYLLEFMEAVRGGRYGRQLDRPSQK